MSPLSPLPITAVTPVVRVFDPNFVLSVQAIRTILHTVFSPERGFTPAKNYVLDINATDAGAPLIFQVEWPPFPAQADIPKPGLYENAAHQIADEIAVRIRQRQAEVRRFQVVMCHYGHSMGNYVSKPFVFEM